MQSRSAQYCTVCAWVSIRRESLQPCWNCMIIYPDRSRDHEAARNKCAHMTDDTDLNPSTSAVEVIMQMIYKCSIDDGDNWNLSRWDGRDMARQPWQCAEDRVVPRNMINPPLTSDTGYLKFTGHETTKLMVFFLGCWSRPKHDTLNNTINDSNTV